MAPLIEMPRLAGFCILPSLMAGGVMAGAAPLDAMGY